MRAELLRKPRIATARRACDPGAAGGGSGGRTPATGGVGATGGTGSSGSTGPRSSMATSRRWRLELSASTTAPNAMSAATTTAIFQRRPRRGGAATGCDAPSDTGGGGVAAGAASSPRSARRTSVAVAGRSSGVRPRHHRIACSHFSSRSGTKLRGDGGASRSRFTAVASGVSPTNGSRPVTISNSTTPKA